MDNYDICIRNGEHRVQITLQRGKYKGHIWEEILGNCRGKSILEFDFESENCVDLQNDCSINYCPEKNMFSAELKDSNGNTCKVEGSPEEFNDMVVALEILDYYESKN